MLIRLWISYYSSAMENLSHSLLGAALAETRPGRRTPLARVRLSPDRQPLAEP